MEQLNELKNLVMQNLQKNGYLSNIRAQIRSSVFKTIDSQESSSKKASPFYTENLKVQKLAQSKSGQETLGLIQQVLSFYEMDNSLSIFNSESNTKSQAKRQQLCRSTGIQQKKDQPILYTLVSKFLSKNKKSEQKEQQKPKQAQKQSQMPFKQDQSEGQVQEDIVRNQSKKFGESQEFGQSHGYDITVDSLKLQQYDYYEQIE